MGRGSHCGERDIAAAAVVVVVDVAGDIAARAGGHEAGAVPALAMVAVVVVAAGFVLAGALDPVYSPRLGRSPGD